MDWKEFLASLVGSLAWPVALVVVLLVFRGSVRGLLNGSLRKLRVGPGGAELEWQEAAGEAAVEAVAAAVSSRPSDGEGDALAALAKTDPAGAVLKAHGELWMLLRQAAGDTIGGGRPAVRSAASQGLISEKTAKALEGLLVLRNLAAHRPEEVTEERATDYVTLSAAVRFALEHDLSASQDS